MRDDDNGGRKPYKTYKAGRAKRKPIDDELAGARPPGRPPSSSSRTHQGPANGDGVAAGGAALAAAPGKDYSRYGPAPGAAG